MIEIFKTNIDNLFDAYSIAEDLSMLFPDSKINFDLEDKDKILRIEGNDINPLRIKEYVSSKNIEIDILQE